LIFYGKILLLITGKNTSEGIKPGLKSCRALFSMRTLSIYENGEPIVKGNIEPEIKLSAIV